MSFIILLMKWLLITDTKDLQDKFKERLMAINKKNKLVTINFKLEDLKKEIKSISTFAGCVIFSKVQNALTNKQNCRKFLYQKKLTEKRKTSSKKMNF